MVDNMQAVAPSLALLGIGFRAYTLYSRASKCLKRPILKSASDYTRSNIQHEMSEMQNRKSW